MVMAVHVWCDETKDIRVLILEGESENEIEEKAHDILLHHSVFKRGYDILKFMEVQESD